MKNFIKRYRFGILAALLLSVIGVGAFQTIKTTAQVPSYYVYNNQLASNWSNWSWSSDTNLSASDNSSKYISWQAQSSTAGLYLHDNSTFTTNGFKQLSLTLKSNDANNLKLFFYTSDWQPTKAVLLSSYKPQSVSDGWSQYSIPLSDLGIGNASINGLLLQDNSGQLSTSLIDTIAFSDDTVTDDATAPAQATATQVKPSDTSAPTQPEASTELETATLPASAGQVFSDSTASQGKALLLWSNGSATTAITTSASSGFTIRAKGDICNGGPSMQVTVDGQQLPLTTVTTSSWQNYTFMTPLNASTHQFSISFTNDYANATCDRNLRLDTISFTPTTSPAAATTPTNTSVTSHTAAATAAASNSTATQTFTNPLAGLGFYVDPTTPAAMQVTTWAGTRPADSRSLAKEASQPTAQWFGDWDGADIQTDVNNYVTAAANTKTTPILVSYNIPNRDCNGYSSGGAPSATAYTTWMNQFIAGIGGRQAVVILEPDALAQSSCLSSSDQAVRLQLLSQSVQSLKAAGVVVYIDAGHANWIPAKTMASLLTNAGIAYANGFSLNVSNYDASSSEQAYGASVSALVGGKHFVIDTGRNGVGSTEWCNPDGQALGTLPTANTGSTLTDAFLWIKPPGESDGTCNNGPAAGSWWPDEALALARNAGY